MKALKISDAQTIIYGLQDEIRRTEESRYDHRLHAILLVAHGMSCRKVANLLGDGERTVQYWVNRFEEEGLAGLVEAEKSGRPSRLNKSQLEKIGAVLRKSPNDVGLNVNLWDGKTLSKFIKMKYDISLGTRQCQRLFRQLGFRFRKPRPLIANSNAEEKEEYKKNPKY